MTSREIVALRETLGLTQLELARALTVPSFTVERWETGMRTPVSTVLDVLCGVRAALESYPTRAHEFGRKLVSGGTTELVRLALLHVSPK